jgi:glycosyltransferase involved in cell wall biosynthesis
MKRIGVIMYQTSNSKGQELVAQRMVRNFNRLGQKAFLITSVFHDNQEVIPAKSLRQSKGYIFCEDEVLKVPVIRVDSYVATWPPRRIVLRDFIHILESIVDEYKLNVLITHSTLWNAPEEVAKFIIWRRDMRNLGGYRDPIAFCHMSHFQEPSPQRYSLVELAYRTAWNKFSLSKVIETANLVLVVTPFEKQAKVKMGAKPDKCFLFPGGVDDEVFLRYAADDAGEFLKRHDINPKTRIISYLGTIEERKNPLSVLKVAESLKNRSDIHFILAGKGGSAYAKEVQKIADNLPNVSYLGEIDDHEKIQLIKVSYLNILMSRLEALGIAQLEFMYHGVPVITSATGGQSWIIQNGIEGLHVKGPEDIKGAATAIKRLIKDEGSYRKMSLNSREKAGKFITSRLVAELDVAVEKELVKENGLTEVPKEVQATISKQEYVLKSWRTGMSGIVATNKRIFVRQGYISRKVTDVRYEDITAIEHARRYPWRTVLIGAIISLLFLLAPFFQSVFSRAFRAQIGEIIQNISAVLPSYFTSEAFTNVLLPMLPLIISLIVFLFRARSGFSLKGAGINLYLSGRFKDAVRFIRDKIDDVVET